MYTVVQDGTNFIIMNDQSPLRTPMGKSVTTIFRVLADRLTRDLEKYGEDPSSPVSLVAFHYAMIDFFTTLPREELEASVALGLERQHDWTLECPTATPEPMFRWWSLFGLPSIADEGKRWLSSLTLQQLCAVCVLGRFIESVNIPFIVATKCLPKQVRKYAKDVVKYYPYVSVAKLVKCFENYLFYFNLENKAERGDGKSAKGAKRR